MKKLLILIAASAFAVSGCAATVKARPQPADMGSEARIRELQEEVLAKDERIRELERQAELSTPSAAPASKTGIVRVAGVTVSDVQMALKRAGIDPGPVDGRGGSKTRQAVKEFQKRKNLKADGIVGKKTWALLK